MSPESKKNSSVVLEDEADLLKDFSVPGIDEWINRAEAGLKGAILENRLISRTIEKIDLNPLYTEKDLLNLPGISGFPGFISYLRGTRSDGYVKNPWKICQEISGAEPEEFNRKLKCDLEMGQTAINLILNQGDSMEMILPESHSDVSCRKGVRLDCLADLSAALSGVKLTACPLYIKTGFSALPMLMMLEALLKQRDEKMKHLQGGIEADPLGFWAVAGKLPISMQRAFDHLAESTNWIRERMAQIKTIGIDVSIYQDAGASATVELGMAMATAVEYINQLQDRNLKIDEISQQIRFTFGIGPNYFMEIAKFRAARILWAKIVQEYGGREMSRKMDVHARTSGYFNSFYDPYMNILRSTTATFSAILGGVDSLHSGTFDEAFSVPDEFSRRIARNIQLILLNESHVNQPVDPAGGSYYLEALTSQVAEKSWIIFQKLMRSGGILESLSKEIPQSMIDRLNRQRRDDFVRLKTVLVGINGYADPNDGKTFFDPDQPVDFKKVSESRDEKSNDYIDCLSFKTPIRDLIREGMLAFESGAALGDVSAALNKLETPSSEIVKIKMFRLAEVFEDLRKRLQVLTKNIGFKPKVFQIQIGQIVDYKSQAAFSKGIFQLPGFEVVTQSAEAVITEINNTVNKSGAAIVVICTGRIELSEEIENIISEVKKIVPDGVIFVSGYPPEDEKRFTQMGVNAFIYRGMDVHKILDQVISRLEEK